MLRYCKHLALIFGLMIVATIGVSAQQFLYVVTGSSTNAVRAYSVSSAGALTELSGSPYATGGNGTVGSIAFFAAVRATIVVANNLLFVANPASNTVSAFTINPVTGALTTVAGSPFATGETGSSEMTLAATSQHLFVSDIDGDNITVFSIGSGGVLTEIVGSPFSTGAITDPVGMMATPNGQYLVASLSGTDRVAVFSIAGSGALTAVSGSPFALNNGTASSSGVDIMSTSNLLFVGGAQFTNVSVNVATIGGDGSLSDISGSPFTTTDANNSNFVLLTPDEKYLFVSNPFSNEITTFSVATSGALTQIPGSPFATGIQPTAMATNYDGSLLYVINSGSGSVGIYTVASGALTQAAGSPVNASTTSTSGIAAFPALLPDQRLPVELTGFSLSSGTSSVQLNWHTASEVENAGFEIQRSTSEEGGFRTIASYINHPELAGLGTTPMGKSYSFTDNELTPGTYQYRLIDVSTDGARKVHPARTIRVESNEEAIAGGSMRLHKITPNPANAEGQVSFALPEEMNVRIDLFSSEGSLVATPVANRNFGAGNHTEAFSTAELPAGTYVVLMTAGIQTRVQRLVVIH
jgi:6-phosphogluconolactonase (cycloisomerase 2 family)